MTNTDAWWPEGAPDAWTYDAVTRRFAWWPMPTFEGRVCWLRGLWEWRAYPPSDFPQAQRGVLVRSATFPSSLARRQATLYVSPPVWDPSMRRVTLWHDDSPGTRVRIRAGLLRRLGLRRSIFATPREILRHYAEVKAEAAKKETR